MTPSRFFLDERLDASMRASQKHQESPFQEGYMFFSPLEDGYYSGSYLAGDPNEDIARGLYHAISPSVLVPYAVLPYPPSPREISHVACYFKYHTAKVDKVAFHSEGTWHLFEAQLSFPKSYSKDLSSFFEVAEFSSEVDEKLRPFQEKTKRYISDLSSPSNRRLAQDFTVRAGRHISSYGLLYSAALASLHDVDR